MAAISGPIEITRTSERSNDTRSSQASAKSNAASISSSYSQQSISDARLGASRASSVKSVSTRETVLSDDQSSRALASPTSSIKSGRRLSRPQVSSLSQASATTLRHETSDPLAFHRRSTQLFPASPTSKSPRHSGGRPSVQRTTTSPQTKRPQAATLNRAITQPAAPTFDLARPTMYQQPQSSWSNDSIDDQAAVAQPVTMHWTSDETRRREYADIDRSRKGFRGLWNKVAPRFARSGTSSRFYDETDGSDAGSVRRFRLDMPSSDR